MKAYERLRSRLAHSKEIADVLRPLNMFICETFGLSPDRSMKLNEDGRAHQSNLAGSLFAVKDCFSTKGIPTTCGSLMLSGYEPPFDATVVTKLLQAGCVMTGKTNMDEFCMGSASLTGVKGPVKNPWTLRVFSQQNPNITPEELRSKLQEDWFITGGSSGGSAVAVATGVARVALGSDTGGSTRSPAACCGVVGLKPTYGLASRHGLIPLVNSLDVPGILSKTVRDAALTLDVIEGQDDKDSTTVPHPSKRRANYPENGRSMENVRIGIPKEYHIPGLSEEVLEAWGAVADLLENEAGCRVKQVSLPHTQYSIVCYHVIGECDLASNMARYDGVEYGYRAKGDYDSLHGLYADGRHAAFNEVVRRRILAGNYFLLRENFDKYVSKAMRVRRLIARDFRDVFRNASNFDDGVDVLLTPVTSSDAPLASEFRATDDAYDRERVDDYFTQPVNMAGIPSISLPIRLSKKGLPISLQLVGNSFEEPLLFAVAKWIESRVNFPFLKTDELVRLLGSDPLNTLQKLDLCESDLQVQ